MISYVPVSFDYALYTCTHVAVRVRSVVQLNSNVVMLRLVQMRSDMAFRVEDPVVRAHIGALDTNSFVLNKPHDIFDWLDSSFVSAAFLDPKCGDGIVYVYLYTQYRTYIRI